MQRVWAVVYLKYYRPHYFLNVENFSNIQKYQLIAKSFNIC